ncbi:MAG: hypothetical protein JWN04_5221 [Myxococcaceae bacterium]|nr:hypothetical protein [Myxococcaceae bacterium]
MHVAVRHRAQPVAEGDVIVDVDFDLLPLGDLEAVSGQRQQRRAFDFLEHLQSALAVVAHAATVEIIEAHPDGFVERSQRVELAVAVGS